MPPCMVPNTVAEQPEEDETVLKLGLAEISIVCCTICRPGLTTAARRNSLPRKAGTTRERSRPSPPFHPSCLLCSSARRRHSSQHSGGRGRTDGRGQSGQCTGQKHMSRVRLLLACQVALPWAWPMHIHLLHGISNQYPPLLQAQQAAASPAYCKQK